MKPLAVIIAASLILTACASSSKTDTSQLSQKETSGNSAAAQNQKATQTDDSIYFDFDKSDVKSMYMADIKNEVEFLKNHSKDSVTVAGNADERGSDEYNLALGSRRAHVVRKDLELLGINAKRIHTVSYGKERPRLTCHEEKCWKENRRVDFDNKANS
jgi:peptidoglycan-associated lipoprotein